VPARSTWRAYIKTVCFFLHRFRSNITVRRFAPIAHANVRTLQDDFAVTVRFSDNEQRPAALGFELEVDGFYMDVAIPRAGVLAEAELPVPLAASTWLAFLRE